MRLVRGDIERVDRAPLSGSFETIWLWNSSRSRRSTWAGSSMPGAGIGSMVAPNRASA